MVLNHQIGVRFPVPLPFTHRSSFDPCTRPQAGFFWYHPATDVHQRRDPRPRAARPRDSAPRCHQQPPHPRPTLRVGHRLRPLRAGVGRARLRRRLTRVSIAARRRRSAAAVLRRGECRRSAGAEPVAARRSLGALPDDRPGFDRHRARRPDRRTGAAGARVDRHGGRRRGPRLRAAGHARQSVCRPGDSGREAISRRPLGEHRGHRRARDRHHVAGDQDPHAGRQLRRRAQQLSVQGHHHQLL